MDKNGNPDCLTDFFQLSMFASGTPSAYQKAVSKDRDWKANTCSCSPSEAIAGEMIKRPELNLVKGSMERDFPAALKAVLKREIETCSKEPFLPRILVNCNGRDQIADLVRHPFVVDGIAQKKFHVVTIHSPKDYADDNRPAVLKSMVDGRECDSQESYDVIENLDDGYFGDDLPVFVFQVGMIGEGINVKCFNATIVTTHSDRTAMQQIGRAVRNYSVDRGPDKIHAGHAAVYAFVENQYDLQKLVLNLLEYDLTSDCYDWGKEIDVSNSSSCKGDGSGDKYAELNGFVWDDVDVEIMTLVTSTVDAKAMKKAADMFAADLVERKEIISEFMEAMKKDPEYFKEFGIDPTSVARFDRRDLDRPRSETAKSSSPAEKKEAGPRRSEKKEKTSADLAASFVIQHLCDLKLFLDSHPDAVDIWEADRRAVMDEVFANDAVADFFDKRVGDDLAARLVGRKPVVKTAEPEAQAKPKTEPTHNNDVKENNECPETSAPKSTAAAPAPTPASTSASSTSTSAAPRPSGVWRWLTSLLRR